MCAVRTVLASSFTESQTLGNLPRVTHSSPKRLDWNSGCLDPDAGLLTSISVGPLLLPLPWLPLLMVLSLLPTGGWVGHAPLTAASLQALSRPGRPLTSNRGNLCSPDRAWAGDFHSRVAGLWWSTFFSFATWSCDRGLRPGAALVISGNTSPFPVFCQIGLSSHCPLWRWFWLLCPDHQIFL